MTTSRQITETKNYGKAETKIVFRNQQLLDLWNNEMSGQISDGQWENSRNTEWLWSGVTTELGTETKVYVANNYVAGKKTYPMTKDLWSIIGDRILIENGFSSEKEAKTAWKEINEAIKNYEVSEVLRQTKAKAVEAEKLTKQKAVANLKKQLIESNWLDKYSFSYEKYFKIKDAEIYFKTDPNNIKYGKITIELKSYKLHLPEIKHTIKIENFEQIEAFIENTVAYLKTIS